MAFYLSETKLAWTGKFGGNFSRISSIKSLLFVGLSIRLFGIVLNHLVNFFSSLTPLKLKRWKPKIRLVQKVFSFSKRACF